MSAVIRAHVIGCPPDAYPVPSEKRRDWFEQDARARGGDGKGHARHCLPLMMANSLGYVLRSPGSFRVTWDGEWDNAAIVTDARGVDVDEHAAMASFVVQPGLLLRTDREGDFVWVKPLPNVRAAWFTPMEAVIEAWWNPGRFGLVCLMNRPGTYTVARGEPLAQLVLLTLEAALASLVVTPEPPTEYAEWQMRRSRPGYVKDHDYVEGRHPDGRVEPGHVKSWRVARRTAA